VCLPACLKGKNSEQKQTEKEHDDDGEGRTLSIPLSFIPLFLEQCAPQRASFLLKLHPK